MVVRAFVGLRASKSALLLPRGRVCAFHYDSCTASASSQDSGHNKVVSAIVRQRVFHCATSFESSEQIGHYLQYTCVTGGEWVGLGQ